MPTKAECRQEFNDIKKKLKEDGNCLAAFKEISEKLQIVLADLEAEDATVYFSKKHANKNFNWLLQICLQDVPSALLRVFNVDENRINNAKKYKKMEERINCYLTDLIRVVKLITEPTSRKCIVQLGMLPLVPFYKANKKVSSELIKPLVEFWSTGAHDLRVNSFVIIYRICQPLPTDGKETIIKSMYEAYIKNCKNMSPSTLPLIDFMRISLTEMYLLDEAITYKHCFGYMRLMAIQLRNALTKNTDDSIRIVYCWQFINALHLWIEVLSKSVNSEALKPLINPLIGHTIGVMSLSPTPTYAPLILNLCKILTKFSRKTKVFVPLLPHLLKILNSDHFTKESKPNEDKKDWNCVLSLSKAQLASLNYVTEFVSLVLDAIKDYMSMESASVGFPELEFIATGNLEEVKKHFNDTLRTKIDILCASLKRNGVFIEKKRADIKTNFSDMEAIALWEIATAQAGTPLTDSIKVGKKKKTNKTKKRQRNGKPIANGNNSNKELAIKSKSATINWSENCKKKTKATQTYVDYISWKSILNYVSDYDSDSDPDYVPHETDPETPSSDDTVLSYDFYDNSLIQLQQDDDTDFQKLPKLRHSNHDSMMEVQNKQNTSGSHENDIDTLSRRITPLTISPQLLGYSSETDFDDMPQEEDDRYASSDCTVLSYDFYDNSQLLQYDGDEGDRIVKELRYISSVIRDNIMETENLQNTSNLDENNMVTESENINALNILQQIALEDIHDHDMETDLDYVPHETDAEETASENTVLSYDFYNNSLLQLDDVGKDDDRIEKELSPLSTLIHDTMIETQNEHNSSNLDENNMVTESENINALNILPQVSLADIHDHDMEIDHEYVPHETDDEETASENTVLSYDFYDNSLLQLDDVGEDDDRIEKELPALSTLIHDNMIETQNEHNSSNLDEKDMSTESGSINVLDIFPQVSLADIRNNDMEIDQKCLLNETDTEETASENTILSYDFYDNNLLLNDVDEQSLQAGIKKELPDLSTLNHNNTMEMQNEQNTSNSDLNDITTESEIIIAPTSETGEDDNTGIFEESYKQFNNETTNEDAKYYGDYGTDDTKGSESNESEDMRKLESTATDNYVVNDKSKNSDDTLNCEDDYYCANDNIDSDQNNKPDADVDAGSEINTDDDINESKAYETDEGDMDIGSLCFDYSKSTTNDDDDDSEGVSDQVDSAEDDQNCTGDNYAENCDDSKETAEYNEDLDKGDKVIGMDDDEAGEGGVYCGKVLKKTLPQVNKLPLDNSSDEDDDSDYRTVPLASWKKTIKGNCRPSTQISSSSDGSDVETEVNFGGIFD